MNKNNYLRFMNSVFIENDYFETVTDEIVDIMENISMSIDIKSSILLRLRWGLSDYRMHKIQEIADIRGVRKQTISYQLRVIYKKLRHPSRRVFLEEYLESIGHNLNCNSDYRW